MDPNFKRTLILENYEKPFHRGLVDDSTYLKENKNNSSCIDNFDIQLKMNDNKIEDIRFEGEACAIAVSSASISIQKLIDAGKLVDPVKDVVTGENISSYSVIVTIYSSGNIDHEISKKCGSH